VVNLKELLFGPAGVPLSAAGRSTPDGIVQVKKLGLGAMEMEFVRGVKMGMDAAKKVRALAKEQNIVLTAHGPYYVNLNSLEKAKVAASIRHILETARVGWSCGAYSITFHAAFYLNMEKPRVYDAVKAQMKSIVATLKNEGVGLWIRPETTGKGTQFGDLNELIRLSQEVEQVLPCIDFSHLHARSNGKENSYGEFSATLETVENALGKEALENMHAHVSGIDYGEKGEKKHLMLKESDMRYKDLMQAFRDYKVKGIIICESPNLEEDALLMKDEYGKSR
jgi:deoxyribonuclease IV